MKRKKIALDFDGVLHQYEGWKDGSIYGSPEEGAVEAVRDLTERFDLIIFTCREPIRDVADWVRERFGLEIHVTNGKPHADMYIDDRGHHHVGWADTMWEITYRDKQGFPRTFTDGERFN